MPPPLRNHRAPMLGNTHASIAAFSLDTPRAIACQNRTRCSLRPAGGCPGQRVPAAAARSRARFFLAMTTPQRQALRQPVEFTLSAAGGTRPVVLRAIDQAAAAARCRARRRPAAASARGRAVDFLADFLALRPLDVMGASFGLSAQERPGFNAHAEVRNDVNPHLEPRESLREGLYAEADRIDLFSAHLRPDGVGSPRHAAGPWAGGVRGTAQPAGSRQA
jgi:hypothetical protein